MATHTLEEHIRVLQKLFLRLKECNLTARPTKCFFGHCKLEYLGRTETEVSKVRKLDETIFSVLKLFMNVRHTNNNVLALV